jgi:hypothetical protein
MPVFAVCGTGTVILLRHELALTYIVTSSLHTASPLKARIEKPAETAVAGRRFSSRHVLTATGIPTTMEDLLEAVFPVVPMLMLFNQDQLPLRDNLETAVNKSWRSV